MIRLINESSESASSSISEPADLIVVHPPWGMHTSFSNVPPGDFGTGSTFESVLQHIRGIVQPNGVVLVCVPEIIRTGATLSFCPQAVQTTMKSLGLSLHHVDFWLKTIGTQLHAGTRWVNAHCDAENAHSILEWLMVFGFEESPQWQEGEILSFPVERDPVHPAVWPYDLAFEIVSKYTKPADHVVDLFMGRGTVARACAVLARRFTGFEICPEYYDRALTYLDSWQVVADRETYRTRGTSPAC